MKNYISILYMLFTATFLSLQLSAQENRKSLKVGETVAQFSAVDDNGNPWALSDFLGKKIIVIYFYPAAMTGGCTKQACSYRDELGSLEEYGVKVLGVSGDYPESLRYFRKAHNLNFTLLSDPEGKIATLFGVPLRDGGEITREVDGKQVVLKRGVTASRQTFVIGKDGKLIYVNQSVNAAADAQQVLELIEK